MPGMMGRMPIGLRRYAAALGCLAVALLLRAAVEPYSIGRYPFVTVYAAILISARYCGLGPSIAVTVLGGGLAAYLFGPSGDQFLPTLGSIGLPLYFLVAVVAIAVVDRQRRDRELAERNATLADQALQSLLAETEERERERRLSAQLRAIVESSDDGIFSKDLNGIVQSWNRGAETIFGYAAAEIVGQRITVILPADRLHEDSDIVERIRHGGRVKHFETIRKRKDGTLIPVSLTVSPIHNAAGEIVGASQVVRDMTEARDLEQQLRQKQKMESLGVLAGGIAHDFNNLLTGIMGNATLAMRESSGPTAERLMEVLNASERAASLVRQMLAYAGKGRFVPEPLNLSAQVNAILPLVRASLSRLITLDLRLAENLPFIEADSSQLQQVIMNLAINGGEAIGESPGTLTVATFARESDRERQVVLQVSDTGAGMDDQVKTRIFDPFFTTKFTGRGLGLAAVLGIIRGHKGSISVDSERGKGSTFTVVFPATARQREKPGRPEAEPEVRGYGTILVVDDEELVRNMARYTLQQLGYTVAVAEDGQAAVDRFTQAPDSFDAVLLDLTMPAMNGEEVLRRLRAIRADIPIVLSSGYTEAEAMGRFESQDLCAFLQKPYTATALARKIKAAVKK